MNSILNYSNIARYKMHGRLSYSFILTIAIVDIIAVVVEVGQTFHEKPHYDNYIKSLRGFVQ